MIAKAQHVLVIAAVLLVALGLAGPAAAAPANQAVVLVSGLNSPTPFSSPAPECAGKEGDVWGPLVAPTLKAQGYNIYTAPESKGSATQLPCGGTPPTSAYIDATAGIDQNGKALGNFLAYLNQTFGITQVQLVAHSYGGLWSRSAITQSSSYSQNVAVASLTTLGSPHTGAFSADIVEGVSGLDCKGGPAYRLICNALQDLAEADLAYLGPEAVSELTSTYVGAWNPNQTIGSCQVKPIAGTYVSLGSFLNKLVGSYYLPNDGLVGAGSAAATTAPSPFSAPAITGLQPASQFDVVHGSALSFLSKNNLLNQPAIVTTIAESLNTALFTSSSAPNCVKNPVPPTPPPTPPTPPPAPVAPVTPVTPSGGKLPVPGPYDVVFLSANSRVRCGKKLINSQPGIRKGKYDVIVAPRCSKRLRVTKGKAIMLRRAAGKKVTVTAGNDGLKVTVRGKGPKTKVNAAYLQGKSWKFIKLSKSGTAKLPAMTPGDHSLPVRVTIKTPRGGRSFAVVIVRVP